MLKYLSEWVGGVIFETFSANFIIAGFGGIDNDHYHATQQR
jgi:hypothetical protein